MFDVRPITSEKAVDCGPTCMAMMLEYYGETANLDELIAECNTDITGCTGKDLLRVGRAHGLDMKPYQTDMGGIINADRPAIIWWKYCHWCVFCGQDDNGNVVICNPDRGRYPLSKGTFATLYSGVALFNGEPEDLPEQPSNAELAEAARILLGVSE